MYKVIDVREKNNYRNFAGTKLERPFVIAICDGDLVVGIAEELDRRYTASFQTYGDAQAFINDHLVPNASKLPAVWVVRKNADFTEGRGPMIVDKVFANVHTAHEYVMSREGIFGSKQYYQVSFGCNIYGGAYGDVDYNGYDISRWAVE